ncbi:hypothetical protein [Asticcacaulis sp. AC402]|uniref:hypothetical protein n=1 Tax=Asticcacaulis sp. AC402 TaxID=1282361 RepID=UPI0003C3E646|nr:hypothetical protein [Asticcacaulis sp. AC402]ESQ77605.1 hypothetical protein ABAC402_00315 [Asticcacaulis sp. AC402]
MVWLWVHSLVLIALTFSLGLVLGHIVSAATRSTVRTVPASASFLPPKDDIIYPPYHGADLAPKPLPAVAEPPRPKPEPLFTPPPRIRPQLLFPINQFGIVTVTQAPAI